MIYNGDLDLGVDTLRVSRLAMGSLNLKQVASFRCSARRKFFLLTRDLIRKGDQPPIANLETY